MYFERIRHNYCWKTQKSHELDCTNSNNKVEKKETLETKQTKDITMIPSTSSWYQLIRFSIHQDELRTWTTSPGPRLGSIFGDGCFSSILDHSREIKIGRMMPPLR